MHLSDVIHDMDVTLLKTQETDIDERTLFQFEKGYLWEVALSRAFAEKAAVRPGEIELDGIIMSPDGVIILDSGAVKCENCEHNKRVYIGEPIDSCALLNHKEINRYTASGYSPTDCPLKVVGIAEYKCTALSSDKSPADNWKWMMQAKGYCKALGVIKCTFRILHHMDIMWHPETCYGVWEMMFTRAELDENWESVLNHAKVMGGRDNG